MAKLPFLRVLIDPEPQSGAWNMAIDEVLLEAAINQELATFRLYRWKEPTATLGYFQDRADFLKDHRFQTLPSVRRLTGGGTLIHDHELTYSLALPASQSLVGRPVELYDVIHDEFIRIGNHLGIPLQRRGTTKKLVDEPLLCFSREDEHDLILMGQKVLGSAQRRRRGAILQHGGFILKASQYSPEIQGVSDLVSSSFVGSFEIDVANAISTKIATDTRRATLSDHEIRMAAQLVTDRYLKVT